MHDLKYKIYFYTEGEFLEMLEEIVNATSKDKSLKGKKLEKYLDTLVDHFIKITEHPKREISFSILIPKKMVNLKTS